MPRRRSLSPPPPGRIFIGPSGWNYPEWRATFYAGVPRRRWLEHCIRQFSGVEVNATFYRLLRPEVFEHWRELAPENFGFAIKGHRFITHVHRLLQPETLIATQRRSCTELGDALRVVLWQLPAGMACNLPRLKRFARALSRWPGPRHAIEFRHDSWFTDAVATVLEQRRIAVCQSDSPHWPLWDRETTDLVYVRLHGHTELYASNYGERALRTWTKRVRAWSAEGREVHVYFDNTAFGHAPANALRLKALLAKRPPG